MPSMAMLPIVVALLVQQPAPSAASLDFEFFKTRIQPIFTAKRPAHAPGGSDLTVDQPRSRAVRLLPFHRNSYAFTGAAEGDFDVE